MPLKYLIFITVLCFALILNLVYAKDVNGDQLRCLVCQATMEEMDNELSKIDPKKTVEVSGYRLDAKGNANVKTVSQIKSEIFLSELLDKICDKMDDYVRATWKSNGKLTLLRMIGADGKMNSDMGNVDIIQDGDLNKSLKYYCEGIVDDYEDAIIKHYKQGSSNIDIRVCSEEAKLCSHTLPEPDDDPTGFEGFEDEL